MNPGLNFKAILLNDHVRGKSSEAREGLAEFCVLLFDVTLGGKQQWASLERYLGLR